MGGVAFISIRGRFHKDRLWL